MFALGGVYLVGAGFVFAIAATDRTFTKAQAARLAASWPWWASQLLLQGT